LNKEVGNYKPTRVSLDKSAVMLPPEFQLILNGNKNNPEFRNALHYLKTRGITREDIVRYNIGYCETGEYGGMVIIPSYDEDGKLNFFTGRTYYKDASFKHKNPKVSKDIIGFELLINWNEPITIVEGAFDAIAVKRNAIPLFGKIVLDKLKSAIINNNVKTVYIGLDSDAREKALEICQYFINNGVTVYLIELGNTDPSELGYSEFTKLYNTTVPLTGSNLMMRKMGIMI